MENLKMNKLSYILVGIVALNLVLFLGGKVLVRLVANEVIKTLREDYSPSEYGPGINPDKVGPVLNQPVKTSFPQGDGEWRSAWEAERSSL